MTVIVLYIDTSHNELVPLCYLHVRYNSQYPAMKRALQWLFSNFRTWLGNISNYHLWLCNACKLVYIGRSTMMWHVVRTQYRKILPVVYNLGLHVVVKSWTVKYYGVVPPSLTCVLLDLPQQLKVSNVIEVSVSLAKFGHSVNFSTRIHLILNESFIGSIHTNMKNCCYRTIFRLFCPTSNDMQFVL